LQSQNQLGEGVVPPVLMSATVRQIRQGKRPRPRLARRSANALEVQDENHINSRLRDNW
jgi:hypothetical protein